MDALTTPAAATRTFFSPSDHLRAAVNELKFGWTFQIWPTFPPDSVLYLLGRSYQTKNGKNMWIASQASSPYGRYSEFADDFASRLWFTYRSDFPQLCTANEPRSLESHSLPPFSMVQNLVMPEMNNSDIPEARSRSLPIESNSETSVDCLEVPEMGYHGSCSVSAAGLFSDPPNTKQDKNARIMRKLSSFIHVKRSHRKVLIPMSIQTSDCGWGCMIRSGQMLLAHALVLHFLGRDWRVFRKGSPIRTSQNPFYRQIIRWFHDSWSPDALLSLHRIVQVSSRSPGSWFGPATMCSALIKVMANAAVQSDTLAQIQLYLARDRVIYRKHSIRPR
ncbi:unnamed protein product [Dicrocoelium dendriticum]|nr:unnamed protein product [Dicrocoelium dendriticum]